MFNFAHKWVTNKIFHRVPGFYSAQGCDKVRSTVNSSFYQQKPFYPENNVILIYYNCF